MFGYLKALHCIYIHKSFSYSLPSAGNWLVWDCECIKCNHKFKVKRPNTPRWVSPIRFDKSKPKNWDEWNKLKMSHLTTDPDDPRLGHGVDDKPTPQREVYLVLSEEERKQGFVRPYRNKYIHKTCGVQTVMGQALSETYARDPKFYGATYCAGCQMHRPVAEFTWSTDGEVVGR